MLLIPGGKIFFHCFNTNKMQSYARFEQYGFSEEEVIYWAKQIRLYTSAEGVEALLRAVGFKSYKSLMDEKLGCILVFEK